MSRELDTTKVTSVEDLTKILSVIVGIIDDDHFNEILAVRPDIAQYYKEVSE